MVHELTYFVSLIAITDCNHAIAITRLASSVALAGSFWATIRGKRCPTCQIASGLSGGLPLGEIGMACYLLVLWLTFLPSSAAAAWTLAAAAGAHLVIVGLLLRYRVICLICLLTAAATLLAAATAITLDPAGNVPAALAAPLASVLTWLGIGIAVSAAARRSMQLADRLLAEVAQNEPPVGPGRVRVIVLSKPHCGACDFLQEAVLPELERAFAGVMVVEHRPAAPGTPAPTLLILGSTSLPFIGAAPADLIAPAIRLALGQMPGSGQGTGEAVPAATVAVGA